MKTPRSVEETMTRYPTIACRKTRVREAVEMMEQFQIRHLPIVDDGRVVGITSERDLKKAVLLGGAMSLVAPDYMRSDPYCVPAGMALSRVLRTMADKKYGSAIVVNEHGGVVGIFTTTDALDAFARLLETKHSEESKKHWRVEDILPGRYL